MSVLVFGANTPVGNILAQVDGIIAVDHILVDPSRPADCARLLRDVAPKAVIYLPPAFSHRAAEYDSARIYAALSGTPSALGQVCQDMAVPLVHLSSPEVFDGHLAMSYLPSDPATATATLGQAYHAGELAITNATDLYVILRSSWIFGADPLRTTANITQDYPDKAIIAAPTSAGAVAQALLTMAAALVSQPQKSGTYHLAGQGDVSLTDFERQIALSRRDFSVQIDPAAETGTMINHRLDCRTTTAVFGLERPDWRADLDAMATHAQGYQRVQG